MSYAEQIGDKIGATGKNISDEWKGVTGQGTIEDRQKEAELKAQMQSQAMASAESAMPYNQAMYDQGQQYMGEMGAAYDDYKKLRDPAAQQYLQQTKGTVVPAQKNIMEMHQQNMAAAPTLQQAMDPNNAIQQGWEQKYNQMGANVGRQGQAAAGVLAGLGAQATAQQFGGAGGPMSNAQLQAMQSANQAQSSQAYLQAQARADQLRQQGVDVGRGESKWAYGAGQQAADKYGMATKDFQKTQADIMGTQLSMATEDLMQAGNMAGLKNQIESNKLTADQQAKLAQDMIQMGYSQDALNQIFDSREAQAAMFKGVATAAGTGIGAAYGGPQGAAMGSQLGGMAGGAATGQGAQPNFQGIGALPTQWGSGQQTAAAPPPGQPGPMGPQMAPPVQPGMQPDPYGYGSPYSGATTAYS